jgi:hypothetical protein
MYEQPGQATSEQRSGTVIEAQRSWEVFGDVCRSTRSGRRLPRPTRHSDAGKTDHDRSLTTPPAPTTGVASVARIERRDRSGRHSRARIRSTAHTAVKRDAVCRAVRGPHGRRAGDPVGVVRSDGDARNLRPGLSRKRFSRADASSMLPQATLIERERCTRGARRRRRPA